MIRKQEQLDQVHTIAETIRQIVWHTHKQSLQTLSRPDIGLTLPQMITLLAIQDAQVCRMSDLADCTQQSPGTLTGIVDRLIDDKLVERVRDATDRRVVHVALTAEGNCRLARAEAARCEDMAHVLAHFNEQQLAEMAPLLQLLLSGVQSVQHSTPSHERTA